MIEFAPYHELPGGSRVRSRTVRDQHVRNWPDELWIIDGKENVIVGGLDRPGAGRQGVAALQRSRTVPIELEVVVLDDKRPAYVASEKSCAFGGRWAGELKLCKRHGAAHGLTSRAGGPISLDSRACCLRRDEHLIVYASNEQHSDSSGR